MSQQLINRSTDLKQLRGEGYDIEIRAGHLLVKSAPYVNCKREVRRGMLVVPLGDVTGDVTRQPSDHTAYFIGEHPCCPDGCIIAGIKHSSQTTTLAKGVVVDHMFSAKPKPDGRYKDYHHKVTTYVAHISGPARSIDRSATAQTCEIVVPTEGDSLFNYIDSASTIRGRLGSDRGAIFRAEAGQVARRAPGDGCRSRYHRAAVGMATMVMSSQIGTLASHIVDQCVIP